MRAALTDVDSASDAGDEAMMIRRRLAVPVAVAPRRADAVRLLETDCDVILCDDGLQHYALARDVEIVVVDGMRGFGNGLRLPAGPLREPVSRIEEVDAVVVNGAGTELPGAIRMHLEPVAVVALSGRLAPGRCRNMPGARSSPPRPSAIPSASLRCCARMGS